MMDEFNRKIAKAITPGSYLVDIFPILDILPKSLAPWKREANEDFLRYSAMFEERFMSVKEKKVLTQWRSLGINQSWPSSM